LDKDFALQQKKCVETRVVEAARSLFAERGFHQTAMADIAKKANVSVGAIYRAFESKADIIDAIVVSDTEQILGDLNKDADRARSGQAAIDTVIEQIILRRLREGHTALIHEVLAEGHRNPRVGETISRFYVQYRAIFRELALIASPDLSGEDLDGAEELLLAHLFSMTHRALTQPKLDIEATARVSTKLILRALQSQ
jgi:TetR/AcrR family transcriptional repressor of uid operon